MFLKHLLCSTHDLFSFFYVEVYKLAHPPIRHPESGKKQLLKKNDVKKWRCLRPRSGGNGPDSRKRKHGPRIRQCHLYQTHSGFTRKTRRRFTRFNFPSPGAAQFIKQSLLAPARLYTCR